MSVSISGNIKVMFVVHPARFNPELFARKWSYLHVWHWTPVLLFFFFFFFCRFVWKRQIVFTPWRSLRKNLWMTMKISTGYKLKNTFLKSLLIIPSLLVFILVSKQGVGMFYGYYGHLSGRMETFGLFVLTTKSIPI